MNDRQKIIGEFLEGLGAFKRLLMHASHAKREGKDEKDCPTRAQMATLMVVSHYGPQTVKDLAERFCMSPSAVTQTVDGLVDDDLLKREEGEQDRRQVIVSLTPKGKAQAIEAKKEQFKTMTKVLEPLTDDELVQLKNLHQKLIRS